MPEPLSLNKKTVDRLPKPEKRINYRDSQVRGLYLRVMPTGRKSWYLKKTLVGKPRWIHLGNYPDLSPADARDEVQTILYEISNGDTSRLGLDSDITIADVYKAFISVRQLKPSSIERYHKLFDVHLAEYHALSPKKINRQMVSDGHLKLTQRSPSGANAAYTLLNSLFTFAQARYRDGRDLPVFPHNPVKVLSETRQWNAQKRKTTYIKPAALPAWFEKVSRSGAADLTDYLVILMLTGLRATTILDLQLTPGAVRKDGTLLPVWNPDEGIIGWDNKNNQWAEVPVADRAAQLIAQRPITNGRMFPSWTNLQARGQMQKHGLTHSRHDLRRTFITVAEALEIHDTTVKRLVGHKAQESDVTVGYAVRNVDRLRQAANRIADHIWALGHPNQ